MLTGWQPSLGARGRWESASEGPGVTTASVRIRKVFQEGRAHQHQQQLQLANLSGLRGLPGHVV